MLGWGFADLFAKKTIDEIGDIVSLAWAHLFGTLAFLLMVLYQLTQGKINFPSDIGSLIGLIFFGVLQATVYLLVYKGFGKGQVALLNPVFASFTGLVAIFSIVVFGEAVKGFILVALAIIFIGILLISMDTEIFKSTRRIKISKVAGLKEVGLATILAAIWTLSWDKFVGGKDWLIYAFYMYAFMTLTIFLVAKYQKVNLSFKKASIWKFLVLIGIFEAVAYLSLSLGYSTTSFTSVVALVSGAFSLPTIIFAKIFLKEKVAKIQTIGGFVIIAGIVLLSLFRS